MPLPMWVTKLETKCPPLHIVLNLRRRAVQIPEYLSFRNDRKKRQLSEHIDPKFAALKGLKGSHEGKRCFIIATGPSLTIEDIELIKNEYTFGMNSIARIYDKTDWRPNFYGIQDKLVFEKMLDCVFNQDDKTLMFMPHTICKDLDMKENYINFPYNEAFHYINFRPMNKYSSIFSDDCYDVVYDGYTISYSLLQIAVYMGFKEIYLIGADCSYTTGKKNHFVESGYIDKNAYLNYEKMTTTYKIAKEYAEKNGIKIYNATRGGMLEVFERVSLEDVII